MFLSVLLLKGGGGGGGGKFSKFCHGELASLKIIYLKPQNVMIFFLNKGENDLKNSLDNVKDKNCVKSF